MDSGSCLPGDYYARLDSEGELSSATRRISADWSGLSGSVDAVLNSPDGQGLYVFKGHQFWIYTVGNNSNPVLSPGYPKEISREFEGLPNDLETVFFCSGNTYAIKGNVEKI